MATSTNHIFEQAERLGEKMDAHRDTHLSWRTRVKRIGAVVGSVAVVGIGTAQIDNTADALTGNAHCTYIDKENPTTVNTYTVEKGDTLTSIASQYNGDTRHVAASIRDFNALGSSALMDGVEITLPIKCGR